MSTHDSSSASQAMGDTSRPTSSGSRAPPVSSAPEGTDLSQHNQQVGMQHSQSSLRSPQFAPNDATSVPPSPFVRSSSMNSKSSLPLQAPGRLFKPLDWRAPSTPKSVSITTSATSESVKEVPDWISESKTRYVAPGVVADYDSLLLTHPDEVNSWRERFGYDNREIACILQFFEHVMQLKGQQYIRTILQKRTEQALKEEAYDELDELDPLRLFREQRGVPPKGFVLQAAADGARPKFDDNLSLGHDGVQSFKHGQRQGDQILRFAKSHDPIQVGTTLSELVRDYPNHLQWEFLDAFVQQGVTGIQFVKAMEGKPVKKILDDAGFWAKGGTTPRNHESFVRKNMRLRRDEIIAKYGVEAAHTYLNSPIKLRELGDGIQLGNNTELYSDVRKYVVGKTHKIKKQEEKALAGEDTSQRQVAGHGMRLSPRTHLSPATSSPKAANLERSIEWSNTLKGKEKATEGSVGRSGSPEREEARLSDERLSKESSGFRSADQPEGITMPSVHVSLDQSGAFPLGQIDGHSFWASIEEHDTHMRMVSASMEQALELARQIIDHDETTANLLDDRKAKEIVRLLQHVSTGVQGRRYTDFHPIAILGDGPSLSPATLCKEVELEVRLHLAEGADDFHSLSQPTVAGVHQLKQEATRRHIQLHRAQTHLLAGAVEGIIRGENSQIHWIKAADNLGWAEDLVQTNTSTVAAATRSLDMVRCELGHQDALKTAIALEIEGRIISKHGLDLADLQLLRARQKEARSYVHAIANSTFAAGAGTPLAPSLREDAVRKTREIIDQIESDLLKLREPAERGATVSGRRGRENDKPDEEDQQRRKNWQTLKERNLALKYMPKDFTTELEAFLSSGKEQASLRVDEEDGSLQIIAGNGIAADNNDIPRSTPELPTAQTTNAGTAVAKSPTRGVKRKPSEGPSTGDANPGTKKVRTNARERTSLVLQEDGSFEEEEGSDPASAVSSDSFTTSVGHGSPSLPLSDKSAMPEPSAVDRDQEALEMDDFNQLFGAGADDTITYPIWD